MQLIATLLHDPDLIILDEPQSGLDPVNMVLVRNLLRDLRDEGRTILLSTHMMGEAERMADEIVLIHRGRVVLDGAIDQVRSSFGENTLHIDFEAADGSFLAQLPHGANVREEDWGAGHQAFPLLDPAHVGHDVRTFLPVGAKRRYGALRSPSRHSIVMTLRRGSQTGCEMVGR